MKQLTSFKNLSRNDKAKLIHAYHKDKTFRLLLKNSGLNIFARLLTPSEGSVNAGGGGGGGGGGPVVVTHPQFSWQGNSGLSTFIFDVFFKF
jgi:hypothetical protein